MLTSKEAIYEHRRSMDECSRSDAVRMSSGEKSVVLTGWLLHSDMFMH